MDFSESCLDTVFYNGKVVTVNDTNDITEAVGIKGNRIVYVGTNQGIQQWIGAKTKVIDLAGRSLLPGFNDSHFHPILNGVKDNTLDAAQIDTGKNFCKNKEELLQLISAAAKTKVPGEWISMSGYEDLWDTERPTIEELDAAAGDHPLHCMHGGGHVCLYNHKALEYLGVFAPDDANKYPEHEIEIQEGKLTGLLRGNTHVLLMSHIDYTEEQQTRAALKSQELCLQKGITSIGDMGEYGRTSYHVMQKLCQERKFKIRSCMAIHNVFGKAPSLKENKAYWEDLGFLTGLGDEHFRIGPCKIMIDGGSTAPSCATREPYSHDANCLPERAWERDEVANYIQRIQDADCQATAHAIGDLAVEFMVEAYERCFEKDPEKTRKLRHRIEHCTIMDQDLISRMGKMNICPSVSAGLIRTYGAKFAQLYGAKRNRYLAPMRSMLDAGLKCSLHSDTPSGPCGLDCIDGAVNRYDRSTDVQCDRTQAISMMEAIRCYTLNAAYASHEESIKGSIEPGKLADIIVLSGDILEIDPMNIVDLRVDLTMIDGVIEYER